MTDRDRLKKAFREIEYTPFPEMTMKSNLANQFTDYALDSIVDGLLANGVIVPPCKCKDCTYLRESDTTNRMFCTYHGDSYEFEVFPNHYCSNGVGMAKGA